MTEAEWEGKANPVPLLELLGQNGSERKLRLFAVASYRTEWKLKLTDFEREAVEIADRMLDGLDVEHDRRRVENAMREATEDDFDWALDFALELALISPRFNWQNAISCTYRLAERPEFGTGKWPIHREESMGRLAALVRDIFGNPVRPINIDPRWLTSDVVGLALAIYDDRAFERMPILADALMDAGCEDEAILSHCRGDEPHVRGCWVVDLVLGKT